MSEQKTSMDNRKILIIVVIVLLVIINGVQWYLNRSNEQKNRDLLDSKNMELVSTYAKLDSISTQLELKIEQLQELGGNVDSLLLIKEELENEKNELKRSRNLAQARYNRIKGKLEGYEVLLKKKDQEIAHLKEVNQELLDENINLKEEKNTLNDQISSLQQEKGKLQEKVSAAATLKAMNIQVAAVNKRGKEKVDSEFKQRHIDQLKVAFHLDENHLAELGTKTIMLRITDPEGSALYNVAAGSGSFSYEGSDIFYTASKDILFDNSKQPVNFMYEKGSEFKKGPYQVELYSEGVMIGKTSFIVK
ncbi:chromosome segregation protein SMC [Rapidithrix thailandica]|uniref:Chromosome segregation protein SMC n=1 Tax=Rapidithrix thailandica TaxID=413964 RepID=A0AAW9S262_9BACT